MVGPKALEVAGGRVGNNQYCVVWSPGHPTLPQAICLGVLQPCWVEMTAGGQPGLEGLRGIGSVPNFAHSPGSGVRCAKVRDFLTVG